MKFNICVVKPDGYLHSGAFAELAEVVGYGLQDLGHEVGINVNQYFSDATNVVIGCHLLPSEMINGLPSSTIVLNTEQVYKDDTLWNEKIYACANRYKIWDYSKKNLEKLEALGVHGGRFLQIGYHEKLTRLTKPMHQDIDVLFYGAVNERRHKVLSDLKKTGLRVEAVFGMYGAARDRLIERAKVVLNMHYYESKIFEIVRVFYLMANKKAVVSEVGQETSIDECYRAGVCGVPYESLVQSCIELVKDNDKRVDCESRAYQAIRVVPQAYCLKKLIGSYGDSI